MRPFAALLIALALSCHEEPIVETDTRDPIATEYVGAPEMQVHKWARDESPVITKFLNGESVPILARKGDWVQVRTGSGSGWAHAADLGHENPTVRFRTIPSPITAPGAHGTIYIEADVNTDGDVTTATVIQNTSGSEDLAARNMEALRRAKFYPLVRKGDRKPFKYDYRVDY